MSLTLLREDITDANQVQVLVENTGNKKELYISGPFLQAEVKNKNGRIYPLEVMENAVNLYIENNIKRNMAYGELNHPCFWENTMALTKSGWKYIRDVEQNEEVLTIDLETQESIFNKVKEVKILPYKGKMLHFKGRGLNTKVTPDHKFVVRLRNGSLELMTAQSIYDKWKANDSWIKKCSILKKSTGVLESSSDNISIAGIEFNKLNFVRFLGFYLAEGCTSQRRKNSPTDQYRIQVFQKCNTEQEFNFINEMLNSLSDDITFSSYEQSNKDRMFTWTSHNRQLGEWLYNLGNCYTKYIPQEVIDALDAPTAEEFINWFVLGDGRGTLNEKYSQCNAFSASENLIKGISLVSAIAGIPHRLYSESYTKDVMIEDRIIKAENKNDMYFIQFLHSSGTYIDNRFLEITEEDRDDHVYCLTMENNPTFLAKDGGYTFWTGNCGPQINLDRVSHLITELKKSGTTYYGKAKIVEDTPCGKIVAGLLRAGANLGVSSRGMGSIQENNGISYVQNDFRIATAADVVADPSAPDAYVQGLMESADWIWEGGIWKTKELEQSKQIIERTKARKLQEAKFEIFCNALKSI